MSDQDEEKKAVAIEVPSEGGEKKEETPLKIPTQKEKITPEIVFISLKLFSLNGFT
jgi:hypothetical protein